MLIKSNNHDLESVNEKCNTQIVLKKRRKNENEY